MFGDISFEDYEQKARSLNNHTVRSLLFTCISEIDGVRPATTKKPKLIFGKVSADLISTCFKYDEFMRSSGSLQNLELAL